MSGKKRTVVGVSLWALLLTLLLTATLSMGVGEAPATTGTATPVAADGIGAPPGDLSNPALQKYVATPENPSAPLELLPAKRWSTSSFLYNKLGPTEFLGPGQGVMISTAAFMFSGTLWNLLLTVLNWALTVDFITGATTALNNLSMQLASSLWSSGLIAILALVTLVLAARALLRGGLGKSLGLILAFVIPIAGLQILMSGTSSGGEPPKLSPAWLAEKGSYISTEVGSGVLVSLTEFLGYNGGSEYVEGGTADGGYCVDYASSLYATYAAATDAGAATIDAASTLDVGTQAKSMILVSTLWEKGFLDHWIATQYGNPEQGQRMFCTQLEMEFDASPQERYAIVGGTAPSNVAAGGEEGAAVSRPGAGSPFAGWGVRPFTKISGLATYGVDSSNHANAQVFAWAACDGPKANPGWSVLGDERVSDENCAAWANSGGFESALDPSGVNAPRELFTPEGEDAASTPEAMTVPGDPKALAQAVATGSSEEPSQVEALQAVEQTQMAFWGQNSAQRTLQGGIAALAASLYAYSLGIIALGVVLAQILLAILLALLPVSLILAAIPSQRSGSNPGWRMLKMTAAALFSKVVLLFILTLLLIMTNVIAGLDSSFGADAGLLAALAPLIAFLALKFILKRAGLGSVMSPGGALGLTTGASLQAVGETKAATTISDASTNALNSPKRAFQDGKQRWDRMQGNRYRNAKMRELKARSRATMEGIGGQSNESRSREVAAVAAAAAATGAIGRSLAPDLRAVNKDQDAAAAARENAARPAASGKDAEDNLSRIRAEQKDSAATVATKQGLREAAMLNDAEVAARNASFADQRDLGVNAKYLSNDTLPLNPVINDGAVAGTIGSSGEVHAWGAVPAEVQDIVGAVALNMAQADNFAKGDLDNYMRAAQHAVLVDMGLTDLTGAEYDLRAMFSLGDAEFNPGDVVPQLQAAAQEYLDKYAGNPERIRQAVAEGAQVFLSGVNTNRQTVEIKTTMENLGQAATNFRSSVSVAAESLPGLTHTIVNADHVASSVRSAISAAASARTEAVNTELQIKLASAASVEERRDLGRVAQRDLEQIELDRRQQETEAASLVFKLDSAGFVARPGVVNEYKEFLGRLSSSTMEEYTRAAQAYRDSGLTPPA